MAGRLGAIWTAVLHGFINWCSRHILNMKSSMRWITSFWSEKKINYNFIDCLCFYKSVYVYCSLYLFCFILQAVSTDLSTTSSYRINSCISRPPIFKLKNPVFIIYSQRSKIQADRNFSEVNLLFLGTYWKHEESKSCRAQCNQVLWGLSAPVYITTI